MAKTKAQESRSEREYQAQRARAHKAAAMGPARTSMEDVFEDVVGTMDLDARRLRLKAEEGEPLTVGESQILGNYARVLSQAIAAKAAVKGAGKEEGMTDEQIEEELQKRFGSVAKQAAHAEKQGRRS